MGIFVLPGVYYPAITWPSDAKFNSIYLKVFFSSTLQWTALGAAAFAAAITVYPQEYQRLQNDTPYGPWAHLIGFIGAQFVFVILLSTPLFIVRLKLANKDKKKK